MKKLKKINHVSEKRDIYLCSYKKKMLKNYGLFQTVKDFRNNLWIINNVIIIVLL